MIHRISLWARPKIFLIPVFFILIFAGGIFIAFAVNLILGLLIALGAAFFLYQTFNKIIKPIIKGIIETREEGIYYHTGYGKTTAFPFKEITHAGLCTDKNNKEYIFLYNEDIDSHISIPDDYNNFDVIKNCIKENTDLEIYSLKPGQVVMDLLKEKFKG